MTHTCLLLIASAVLLANPSVKAEQRPISPSDIAQGRAIYVAQGCYLCHGLAGQGSIYSGPALVPLSLDDDGFRKMLRSPVGAMPRYSEAALPSQTIFLLETYVRALPPGPPAAKIPLLAPYVVAQVEESRPTSRGTPPRELQSVTAGRRLYLVSCATCHGVDREGSAGPNLQSEAHLRTEEQIVSVLLFPPAGMPRLSPQPLSLPEIHQIAAYLHQASK
jgi:ubiquinol-cytochrome c reductase cytochrome c subunit